MVRSSPVLLFKPTRRFDRDTRIDSFPLRVGSLAPPLPFSHRTQTLPKEGVPNTSKGSRRPSKSRSVASLAGKTTARMAYIRNGEKRGCGWSIGQDGQTPRARSCKGLCGRPLHSLHAQLLQPPLSNALFVAQTPPHQPQPTSQPHQPQARSSTAPACGCASSRSWRAC